MAANDTIAAIANELGKAIQPLEAALSSPEAARDFLEELGWDISPGVTALNTLSAPVNQVSNLFSEREEVSDAALQQLLQGVRAVFQAIDNLRTSTLPAHIRDQLPRQITDYLIVEYLLNNRPEIGGLLCTLGIIDIEFIQNPGANRVPFFRRSVAFEKLGDFFSNPLKFFADHYKWGQSDFRGTRLLENFEQTLEAWGFPPDMEMLTQQELNRLNAGALQPDDAFTGALIFYLWKDMIATASAAAGFGLFLLPETATDKPGLAFLPFARGEAMTELPLTEDLELILKGEVSFVGGLGILIRPNRDLEFKAGLDATSVTSLNADFSAKISTKGQTPKVLIGSSNASRLQIGGVSFLSGLRFHNKGKLDLYFEFDIREGKIVVKAGDQADGFIRTLLPGDGLQVGFDLSLGFSTSSGFYFGGSSGLEIMLPAHIQLGPVEIQQALISLKPRSNGTFPLSLGTTLKGDLGVLKATVENIGIEGVFSFPSDGKGNLGPVQFDLRFKPPNGIGLVVDAGVVRGGGYLFFDFDKGEYAGALELMFAQTIELKAIGLINTKMPDGSGGFSLLIIITAEFVPGLQLGFGFALVGVGGLLGLHRTMKLDAMAEGVRTGGINSVLFPRDVVANAPRIISDLKQFFPIQKDKFLIGPMAKIGWGTPVLISVSLGIIIEIPGNIAIVGRLRLNLPTEDQALVLIQVTFIGAIEFDKKRIWFFASLFESRVLFITLEGEMGLLMDFGNQPNFVISVGGFHPRFKAPALPFPSPRRIALSIVNTSVAKVRVEGYFAVTSNTVQFGARAEAFFGFDSVNVSGHIGFDALLQFSPFYFVVDFSAAFSAKVFGIGLFSIRLRGMLEGPAPWHIQGEASISLLFFDISINVDVTFGESNKQTLPPIAAMPLLLEHVQDFKNWKATLPHISRFGVTLRQLAGNELVLHPSGSISISQRALPLQLNIDKVGEQSVQDVKMVRMESASGQLNLRQPLREKFATAQYRKLKDHEKLDLPPFEDQISGIELTAGNQEYAVGDMTRREVRYEEIIVDTKERRRLFRFFRIPDLLFGHFFQGSFIKKSIISQHQKELLQPVGLAVKTEQIGYAVALQANNKLAAEHLNFASYAEAAQYLNQQISADKRLADMWHIIPQNELNP